MYLKFNNDNHITYRIYLVFPTFSPASGFLLLLRQMDSLSSHSFYESILRVLSLGLGSRKSHVNVTFALVPSKRLNSVKVCDKMCFMLGRGEGVCVCVKLSFVARFANHVLQQIGNQWRP